MSLAKSKELAVLSVLVAHPAHGYQIAAAFEKGAFQLLGMKRAAVYAILKRFVERGWITEEEEDGGPFPDRRVSHITDAGRAAVEGLIAEAGGLPQSPLMVLMLLHDSGVDVAEILAGQLLNRRRLIADLMKGPQEHRGSASNRLALATIEAEIAVIISLLEA